MKHIRDYFEKTRKLTDRDWQIFASRLIKTSFPKKHTLLRCGTVEGHLSFIEAGIVRFYIPRDGNDLTFAFAFPHHFVSGYDSFLTRAPSTYQIETLTPTTLWRISHSDLIDIYAQTVVGEAIGRQAAEELFLKKSKRELSLLGETAEQRYRSLFTDQPHLIRHIPLKYIASYIGVTPQALSRIRRRIS